MSSKHTTRSTRPQSRFQLLKLEPRFMFDGAAATTVQHVDTPDVETFLPPAPPAIETPTVPTPPPAESTVTATAAISATLPTITGEEQAHSDAVIDGSGSDSSQSLINQALSIVEQQLQDFAQQADFEQQLLTVFNGEQIAPTPEWLDAAANLRQALLDGHYQVDIKLIEDHAIQGKLGAFVGQGADDAPVIYLNQTWLSGDVHAPLLNRVLLEELGHSIDAYLNGERDTAGDEGERFASSMLGYSLSEGTQDDADSVEITADHALLDAEAADNVFDVAGQDLTFTTYTQLVGTTGLNSARLYILT
ncbi:hypothetical protein SAMN05421644_1852 [Allochromatium warmingii]|uniref:Uncharacterized protein n=1 Tax=Allochromatium warmingii TaxID=61595 RepID=A0A1H3KB45_ALLWA|nr:hypothetical protein [Allochromatium warmingii]SDY48985.1 hypothetical protein SAMN05421644_1852 [Allochromatium warmingii]